MKSVGKRGENMQYRGQEGRRSEEMIMDERTEWSLLMVYLMPTTGQEQGGVLPSRSVSHSVVLGLRNLNKHFSGWVIHRHAFKDRGTIVSDCDAHVIGIGYL
jgi:hypothetical protein